MHYSLLLMCTRCSIILRTLVGLTLTLVVSLSTWFYLCISDFVTNESNRETWQNNANEGKPNSSLLYTSGMEHPVWRSICERQRVLCLSDFLSNWSRIQGDHSACSKPPIDIDLRVAFWYKVLILKRNFQINVNGRFWTSWIVTLYRETKSPTGWPFMLFPASSWHQNKTPF